MNITRTLAAWLAESQPLTGARLSSWRATP